MTMRIFRFYDSEALALLLDNVIKQYEARFGAMDVGTIQTAVDKLSAK